MINFRPAFLEIRAKYTMMRYVIDRQDAELTIVNLRDNPSIPNPLYIQAGCCVDGYYSITDKSLYDRLDELQELLIPGEDNEDETDREYILKVTEKLGINVIESYDSINQAKKSMYYDLFILVDEELDKTNKLIEKMPGIDRLWKWD